MKCTQGVNYFSSSRMEQSPEHKARHNFFRAGGDGRFSKNPRATSKFKAQEGWHETSSNLRTQKYWGSPHKISSPMRAGAEYFCARELEANRARIISKPLFIRVMFSISILWPAHLPIRTYYHHYFCGRDQSSNHLDNWRIIPCNINVGRRSQFNSSL
jgi:hypothetical protein